MPKLSLALPPFAPDTAGAASVLYPLGGMTVIVDAGGCAGNICGFDEPRWLHTKSAVFSAGLRDMDAIMGRDANLVAKIREAAAELTVSFVGLVSTPVPAIIATDFRAVCRMVEKETGLPTIAVGLITDAEQAEAIVADGQADLVGVARVMMYEPHWPWHAAAKLGAKVNAPRQYWRSAPRGAGDLFTGAKIGMR